MQTFLKYQLPMRKMKFISLLIVFTICATTQTTAQHKKKLFKHESDDQFDVSNFLSSRTGFLPIPIIITEPAVGYGGGAVLTYFHKKR